MTGRFAVDFGTSNTVLGLWDETRKESILLHIPEFSRFYEQGGEQISVIPSLVHYAEDGKRWIGNQVLQRSLYQSERTFRWMKRYINHRSQIKVNVDGREISPLIAGQDFLSTVLLFAAQEINLEDEEIALSVPVESYEHYENWLSTVAEAARINRYRLIDEPSAAALGYGAAIQPGQAYMIFDFGGGTLHTSVVLMEPEQKQGAVRRCRVLGKAGRDLGGTHIDQWIFEEVLRLNCRQDSEEEVRRISNILLVECEQIKEKLSFNNQASLSVMNPETGRVLEAEFTRSQFEELLERHNLYSEIDHTIRSAINSARERGYDLDAIHQVMMVGGSSQIPSVQRSLRQIFDRDRVKFDHPLDAIARGAAAFVAGIDFYDFIQHDYGIRFVNPQKKEYDYRIIVQRGTAYPTPEPLARLSIKASYEGQRQMGIAIFEMGQQHDQYRETMELVFDPGGAARIVPLTPNEQEQRSLFWMNEHNPTFLIADPAAQQGEPRFEVEFRIDANKRLTITARDIKTGVLTHRDFPVVKLT